MLRKLMNKTDLGRLQSDLEEAKKRIGDLKKAQAKDRDAASTAKDKVVSLQKALEAQKAQAHLLARDIDSLKLLCGGEAAARVRQLPPDTELSEAEFRVFSQWGEDGIIQFLLAHVPVDNRLFVEFGVESYREANTRFLLINNSWQGLIMDGSEEWMRAVRESDLAWRHTLTAKSAWISAENINELISEAGISGDIGLLSVDIDGMDYWVWKALEVVQPRIVIAEFNALFGPTAEITLPYDPSFERLKAHSSGTCYGISLAAVERLGKEKGLRLVGINSAGNNAFLVREDLAAKFPVREAAQIWHPSEFRETRNPDGSLAFPSFEEAQERIADATVYDLKRSCECKLSEVTEWRRQG